LCRAICAVLRDGQPDEAFNVASGVDCTNEDIVRQICELVDRLNPGLRHAPSNQLITHVADRPGHDARYALDTTKICGLGWTPRVEPAAGLEQTVRWYLDCRVWVAEVAANFDRTRRLGTGG
jgi:dTDP-glucose 4,6-dehydratase